ncbi:hypothetical protein GCM10007978_16330 [Shewanella hanedai]|nr:hypothetical protein GCM10007978_16330 [Shewanella hanedai]
MASTVVPEVTNWGLKDSGFPSEQYTKPGGTRWGPHPTASTPRQVTMAYRDRRFISMLIKYSFFLDLGNHFNSAADR